MEWKPSDNNNGRWHRFQDFTRNGEWEVDVQGKINLIVKSRPSFQVTVMNDIKGYKGKRVVVGKII